MFVVSAFSLFFSVVLHALVDRAAKYLNPFRYELSKHKDLTPEYVQKQHFIWQNTCVSFVHAVVSGIWSLSTFYFEPDSLKDLINLSTWRMTSLVSYSLGYFIFDSAHMAILHPYRSTAEFLVHHFIIFLCFSSALLSGKYIGYAAVSLLPEVNSIFLHLRRAMNYLRVPKGNRFFHTTCLLNIGTFIVFRFMVLSWMAKWIVLNRDKISSGYYCLGSIGLSVLIVMNIVLFIRIVYADFFSKDKVSSASSSVSIIRSDAGTANKPHFSLHSS
ncbi:TLC domain-containing protein isoform 1 [Schistosoma japonicum]|uniref:TLC domain-containing protein 1 n=1 Tax=Schistosoma japonicum TaxID=6182 RepID=C1L6L1_SCHJA|nr:TLC domain-containing protein isoform 1 [Schistosoma japonicum]CAX70338.1 TLC domain-containing protein 1 precursor [Schistosoma japonicum]CAX70339.1 TLC domain-containing protein 1 precursor [Schistosoma japonicum]